MEITKLLDFLVDEMESTKKELASIGAKMKDNLDDPNLDYPGLYAREFDLCMKLSNLHDSLYDELEKLKKDKNMRFIINRYAKRATEILESEVLRVTL